MEPKAETAQRITLELVEEVPSPVTAEPEGPIEIPSLEAAKAMPHVEADPFVAQARREQARGIVDAALWKRAAALAGGDGEAAVEPYIRARAAILRLAHGRKQAAASARTRFPVAAKELDPVPPPPGRSVRVQARPRAMLLAAAGLGVAVLAIGAWMMLADEPAKVSAAVASASTARTAAPAPAAASAPVAPNVDPGVELAAKVASLKAQGNFNVMVIYANEWTRKQPGNAMAWHELAGGYRKLRQIDEAFAAAKQAAALDGANPAHLRTLADIYVALERPEDALVELQKALQADGQHAATHAQAGMLYLQLVRLDEARGAFDRALALDPANLGAACGALDVARRQGRGKDAEPLARALRTADFECNAAGESKVATAQSAQSAQATQSARVPSTRR